jgi:hypothetical protein
VSSASAGEGDFPQGFQSETATCASAQNPQNGEFRFAVLLVKRAQCWYYANIMIACKTPQEATDLIKYCITSGAISYGQHFQKELANESLTMSDVYFILRGGNVSLPPEQDIKTGHWKYRLEGKDQEGNRLAIVFCFKENVRGFLITIFSIRR